MACRDPNDIDFTLDNLPLPTNYIPPVHDQDQCSYNDVCKNRKAVNYDDGTSFNKRHL